MSRTLYRAVVVMAASLALTLAACGSDDSNAAGTTAQDTSQAPATTGASTSTAAPGTTAAAAPAKPLRIGFLPPTLAIPAFQGLWHGLEGYGGGRYGDTVVAVEANNDPAQQVQTIQQWTDLKQVDAIWVIPVAGEAIAPALQDATKAGIVVIAAGFPADFGFDGPMPGITFSAIDNVKFGKGIGDMMAECVNKRLGGKSSVIYVGPANPSVTTDNVNSSSHAALAAGAPGAKIVQELLGAADQATTQQAIESALQANPDSDGFMSGDAEATMAGLNAYSGAGKTPTDICVVGNGGTDDQLAAVKTGDLYGTVAFDFQADLTQNVDTLHTMAADPTADGSQLTVPIKIIASS